MSNYNWLPAEPYYDGNTEAFSTDGVFYDQLHVERSIDGLYIGLALEMREWNDGEDEANDFDLLPNVERTFYDHMEARAWAEDQDLQAWEDELNEEISTYYDVVGVLDD